eukprot:TRINITY_DN8205_c0_g1_i1.p1 TRINITY_DN8205_c0_g1~~TRINITY_DN8205_c0_g1_i1.p1  ORF type:complete len:732 (-),score=106.94 TRINITY_DN8205_c0_g1_i1:325-2520(-)
MSARRATPGRSQSARRLVGPAGSTSICSSLLASSGRRHQGTGGGSSGNLLRSSSSSSLQKKATKPLDRYTSVASASERRQAVATGANDVHSPSMSRKQRNSRQELLKMIARKQEEEIMEAFANDPLLSSATAPVSQKPSQPALREAAEQQKWQQDRLQMLRQELEKTDRSKLQAPRKSARSANNRQTSLQRAPSSTRCGTTTPRSAASARFVRTPSSTEDESERPRSPRPLNRRRNGEGTACVTTSKDVLQEVKSQATARQRAEAVLASRLGSFATAASDEGEGEHHGVHPASIHNSASYFTHSAMYTVDGTEVPLRNRDKVLRMLHDLNTEVMTPLCRKFALKYDFLFEQHCQEKKAGVARREPRTVQRRRPDGSVRQETRYIVTIRLRLRLHPSKGDPQREFLSKGAQLAVLLHELCHLKYMDHGKDFMLLLRDIFREATALGIFRPAEMSNEVPSSASWENEIFRTGGDIDTEDLLIMFARQGAPNHVDSVTGLRPRSRTPARCGAPGMVSEVLSPRAEGSQGDAGIVSDDGPGIRLAGSADSPTREADRKSPGDELDNAVPMPDRRKQAKLNLRQAWSFGKLPSFGSEAASGREGVGCPCAEPGDCETTAGSAVMDMPARRRLAEAEGQSQGVRLPLEELSDDVSATLEAAQRVLAFRGFASSAAAERRSDIEDEDGPSQEAAEGAASFSRYATQHGNVASSSRRTIVPREDFYDAFSSADELSTTY